MATIGPAALTQTNYNDFAGNIWVGSKFTMSDVGAGNVGRVSSIAIRHNGAAGIKYRLFIATVSGNAPAAMIGISGEATTSNHSGGSPGTDTVSGLSIDIAAGVTAVFLGAWCDLGGGNHLRPAYNTSPGTSGTSEFKSLTYASTGDPTLTAPTADTPLYDIQATYTVVALSSPANLMLLGVA